MSHAGVAKDGCCNQHLCPPAAAWAVAARGTDKVLGSQNKRKKRWAAQRCAHANKAGQIWSQHGGGLKGGVS